MAKWIFWNMGVLRFFYFYGLVVHSRTKTYKITFLHFKIPHKFYFISFVLESFISKIFDGKNPPRQIKQGLWIFAFCGLRINSSVKLHKLKTADNKIYNICYFICFECRMDLESTNS